MENRRLKYMYQRVPETKMRKADISAFIHRKTGFAKIHINEILDELGSFIEESMVNKNAVVLPKLGMIFPTIKPKKNVVKINNFSDKKAEIIPMEARWICKFKPKSTLSNKMLENTPSEDEVNNIYRDE